MTSVIDLYGELLATKVEQVIRQRGRGHCVRVEDVPDPVARCALRVLQHTVAPPDRAVLVASAPVDPWEVSPTQAVELRNLSDDPTADVGVLVIFVPPKERIAVEDSIGPSTFEVLSVTDVESSLLERAFEVLEQAPGDLVVTTHRVVDAFRQDKRNFGVIEQRQLAEYVLRVADEATADPSTPTRAVGLAVPVLGLIPDTSLAGDEGLESRLLLNHQQMAVLTEPIDPVDRLRQLPFDANRESQRIRALRQAIADETIDRRTVAERLRGDVEAVNFADWDVAETLFPARFEILKLVGDVDDGETPEVRKPDASIGVEFVCEPPARKIPGAHLQLEVLEVGQTADDLEPTGVVFKKSATPGSPKASWRHKMSFGEADGDLQPGLYRLRLALIGRDQAPIAAALSEVFRVGEVEATVPALKDVASVLEAYAIAMADNEVGVPKSCSFLASPDDRLVTTLSVRLEGIAGQYTIHVPKRLAEVEAELLEQPRDIRALAVDVGQPDAEFEWLPFDVEIAVPDEFLDARTAAFEALAHVRQGTLNDDGDLRPTVLAADVAAAEAQIRHYSETWRRALEAPPAVRAQLLSTDCVEVRNNGAVTHVLVGPTHPVRLLWLLELELAGTAWIEGLHELDPHVRRREALDLRGVVPQLRGEALPMVVVNGDIPLRFRRTVDQRWAIWARESLEHADTIEARLHAFLQTGIGTRVGSGESEVLIRALAYLGAHPYVGTFVLNVVRPGTGDFVLRLLAGIQDRDVQNRRFIIRLFGDPTDLTLGRTLDRFMVDPDGVRVLGRDAADRLVRAGRDPLKPLVAFSKHDVKDLVETPERFPAHLSVFLDYFDAKIAPLAEAPDGRGLYGGGVVTQLVSRFDPGRSSPPLAPRWSTTVPTRADAASELERTLRAHDDAAARQLGATGTHPVIALRLELDAGTRSLLDSVHESSDWVACIDPIFSDEYLDGSEVDRKERYVVDARAGGGSRELRNVVVSSKLGREQLALLDRAAKKFGINLDVEVGGRLINGLHLLGAGIGFRLVVQDTRQPEVMSLALGATFLRHEGVLRHALVIPLDEHRELFAEAKAMGETESLSRTDLAVVRLEPQSRRIAVTLVELKARKQLTATGAVPVTLAEEIAAQLSNAGDVLAARLFGVHLRARKESLPAALSIRRLVDVLRRYLLRSERYGFLDPSELRTLLPFVESLDTGYDLTMSQRALVFDLSATGQRSERLNDLTIDVVGADRVMEMLEKPDPKPTEVAPPGNYLKSVLYAEPSERWRVESLRSDSAEHPVRPGSGEDLGATEEEAQILELADVDLIGHDRHSSQFGVLGEHNETRRPVALDTGGTNVISVFGVQGSGKSFTVGNILEAALIQEPKLNRLSAPLGAVVFHYSSDTSYRSEFASMVRPTQDEKALAFLTERGIPPHSLSDVVVLVPRRKLEQRKTEYEDLKVEPLLIGPSELSIAAWKLLMGIEGGNQMYAKAMGKVLRDSGENFTLGDLRSSIASAELSSVQKHIANARLDFVAEYLDDSAHIAERVRRGRLLIVDVRDEFVEKGEALGLFMVLLECFASAGTAGDRFNKVIVFDEAHKYMSEPSLTEAITVAVREMRHKGVSVVIASQDPPSVPREVVELSTVIIAHRFNAPKWLKHLQQSSQAFARVTGGQLASLATGNALVWSAGGTQKYSMPQRVATRMRLTEHGGATLRVGEEA